jgi:diacylglycerol kinase (ATP)
VTSPFGPLLLIANPSAGRGRNAVLPRLVRALTERGLEHRVALTAGRDDATRLAHRAITDDGTRYLVAVGGDGTVNEVVNGMVDAESGVPHAEDLVLGVVAGGTGCDFIKTFGLDRSPERVARHLEGATLYPVDLGRVRYRDAAGAEQVRLFANIAECGWGAEVTRRVNDLPRWLGRARYPFAILQYSSRMRLVPTTVTVDHTRIEEPIAEIVVANGQFFGSGIKIAPRALPDDGIFNVQTWRTDRADVLRNMQRARTGDHLSDPKVREYQSSTVVVEGESPHLIEVDGEVIGTTPATFDLVEKVLRLKI